MLSISSINIIAGALSYTPLKKLRIFSSDYPEIPVTISGPEILKNGIDLFDPATAIANKVFPDPGGPEINIPLGGITPNHENILE